MGRRERAEKLARDSDSFDAFRRRLVARVPAVSGDERIEWLEKLTEVATAVLEGAQIKVLKPGAATRLFVVETAYHADGERRPWQLAEALEVAFRESLPVTVENEMSLVWKDGKSNVWEFALDLGDCYVTGAAIIREISERPGRFDGPRRRVGDREAPGHVEGPAPELNTDRPMPEHRREERQPFGDRPQRPYGDRPQRPYGDRPQRPYGNRPQGDRPQRPWQDRSSGDRPQRPWQDRGDRPQGDRPQRPWQDRNGGDRPQRPWQDRGDCPQGDRPQRPWQDRGDRPQGDRPPRPWQDRADRPQGDRPQRPWQDRNGG
ncbi:MAG: hypothetical protein JSS65_09855, partial [Armatimonadetes bacterium]|nr:hypothetical protein [Armatimonadota bacterium]